VLPRGSRFFGWLVIVALCSAFVTAFAFPVELRCSQLNLAVSFVHREHVSAPASFTDRIVARLEQAELHESDAWYRDAIRIARLTVLYAAQGDPSPHFWATYQVLRTAPDQVWPATVARRKAMLGDYYESIFGAEIGVTLPPKKPVQSVRSRQRARAAAA
jgi:uncharacterized protein YbjT (DUF2867 family)